MAEVSEVDWQDGAACRGRGWSDYFDSNEFTAARATCRGCVVRPQCLEFAIENHVTFGVWGGLTPVERRTVRIRRSSAA